MGGVGAPGAFGAAQHQHVDHAAPADLGGGLRIAGGRPHAGMRVLPRAWPDVHVTMREVLALPAERSLVMAQRLLDEVDRLPVALDVVDRIGVAGGHLGAARLHEADLEAPAGDDIRRGILFGHPNRILPHRDQGAEAENADLARLAGQDAHEQWVGPEQRVDPGVVLDRQHVEPEVVAQEKLVDDLLEEIGGDLRVAVPVRQTGPHGVRGVENLLRHERVRDFALPPSIHRLSLRSGVSDSGTSRRRRRRRRPARSLDDAPPARSARSVSRGSARYRPVHTTASRCRRWRPTARASAP